MANIQKHALGAVGEHQTLSRLLLLGYQAAITNMSVKNTANTDILCRDSNGNFAAIQVKTTSADSFNTGITHKEFYDNNGNIDLAKGKKHLEDKIVGPWVMVQVGGTDSDPIFKFFVFSRRQIIEIIYSNEVWYLTGFHNRANLPKGTGTIFIYIDWLYGNDIAANKNHIAWCSPFKTIPFENSWNHLWID